MIEHLRRAVLVEKLGRNIVRGSKIFVVGLDKGKNICYSIGGSDIVICGYAGQALTCGAPADGRYFFYILEIVEPSFVCVLVIMICFFYRDFVKRNIS